MLGEDDLSSRFDYLFEPLDDESADETIDAASAPGDRSIGEEPSHSAVPVRMAFTAFVLATLGAVAVVAVLLMQGPIEPTGPAGSSLEPTPLSTAGPNVPPQPGLVAPPVTPTEAPQTIKPGRRQQPEPQRPPTPAQREPEEHVSISPSTRAPISVAPETRPPFPNERPPGGGPEQGGGGILGGLPGPDLPGRL